MRIVFPTKENMSYISHSASSLNDADYLTVLNITGEKIVDVEIRKNHTFNNKEEIVKEFRENNYEAIVVPSNDSLPIKDLNEAGISIYNDKPSQIVLNAFNDYLHNKLVKVS